MDHGSETSVTVFESENTSSACTVIRPRISLSFPESSAGFFPITASGSIGNTKVSNLSHLSHSNSTCPKSSIGFELPYGNSKYGECTNAALGCSVASIYSDIVLHVAAVAIWNFTEVNFDPVLDIWRLRNIVS
jgi:hypothetical protein